MRVSDTEAAQRVADNDNLVGELVEALSRLLRIHQWTTLPGQPKSDAEKFAEAVLAKVAGD